MKTKITYNLIFVFSLVLMNLNVFATNPTAGGDEKVSVVLMEEGPSGLVTDMSFNEEKEQMDIITSKNIMSIQLMDENDEAVFFLPVVGSSELNVGVSQFEEGTYYLKMLLEGENDYVTAKVIKKI